VNYSVLAISLTTVAESTNHPQWWETTQGVIAIPAALLGIFGTYFLIVKTRLESKKLQLEIDEKQRALDAAKAAQDPIRAAEIIAEPTFEVRRVQDVILRAILLFLLLSFWTLIQTIFSVLPFGGILSLVYWLVFVAMGWPILLDVLKTLRIDVPKYLQGRAVWWLIIFLTALLYIAKEFIGGLSSGGLCADASPEPPPTLH